MPLATNNTTDWTEVWYPTTMSSLMQLAGPGFRDTNTGSTMPRMSSVATMAFLGLVTPGVVSTIESYYRDAMGRDANKAATRSMYLNDKGQLGEGPGVPDDWLITGWNPEFIDTKTYLGYSPDFLGLRSLNPYAWPAYKRYAPGVQVLGDSWEIYFLDRHTSAQDISGRHLFVRQLIADWQRAVDASAASLLANATDTTQPTPAHELSEFLSAIRSVCNDLDSLNAVPPEFNRITDALRHALAKTSEFTGKAVAEVANEAGKLAGLVAENTLEGFLANAGVYSFIVAGLVIYFFVK